MVIFWNMQIQQCNEISRYINKSDIYVVYSQFPCMERLKQKKCSCWACSHSADTVHKPDSVHKPLPGSDTRAVVVDIPFASVGEDRLASVQRLAVVEDLEVAAVVSSSV